MGSGMPPVPTVPVHIAITLLVFSVLGTLGGIWIAVAVLRQVGLRRLTSLLAAAPRPAASEDDYFGLPGTGNVARGLLQLIAAKTGCSFVELFLPQHGDDCMTVVTLEGAPGVWEDAELPYVHPVVRRLVATGDPV